MESRSRRAALNIRTGIWSKVILSILAFATKTIFVRLLGAEYNGVSGLYSNILTVLSLADLGIGNVLTYSLYQALKDDDKSILATLVFYFKKIYRIIACAILAIGISIIPFLKYILNSSLPYNELVIYYILYLLNSCASYFVAYKTMMISADQKNYITNICSTISTVIMYVFQMIYLLLVRDFFGYLIIQVLCTFLTNVILSRIAERMYPFLSEYSLIDRSKISAKMIKENLSSTFIYKICVVLINNTDNILISILMGTVHVGYYSNYQMLVTYVNNFIGIFTTGMLASLGNLNAGYDRERSYAIFSTLGLFFAIIANFGVCCFTNCIQYFIPIWLGEEYVLDRWTVASILLVFYISTTITPVWMFRETMGLFKEAKYIMTFTVILNIILSILFGKWIGLPGIILATFVAKLLTHYWYEPNILYEKKFGKKRSLYFWIQIKNLYCTVLCLICSIFACSFLPSTFIFLFIRVIVSGMIVLILESLFYHKTDEFKELLSKVKIFMND